MSDIYYTGRSCFLSVVAGGVNMLCDWIRSIVQPDVDQLNLDCSWRCPLHPNKALKHLANNRNLSSFILKRLIRHDICPGPSAGQLCAPDSTSISLPHPHIQRAFTTSQTRLITLSATSDAECALLASAPTSRRTPFKNTDRLLTALWAPAVRKRCP